MNSDRIDHIRKQAITIFELTKGFIPEQRQNFSNGLNSLEEMSCYVLELTDQLKQRDQTIKELKKALKNLVNHHDPDGDTFLMEHIEEARKLIDL